VDEIDAGRRCPGWVPTLATQCPSANSPAWGLLNLWQVGTKCLVNALVDPDSALPG
jgi:hypothetical protein